MSRWLVFSVFLVVVVAVATLSGAGELSPLSGMVIDSSSCRPPGLTGGVEGASVYVPELNTGTVTSKGGVFVFDSVPDGVYTVRVSLVGYAPVSRTITVPVKGSLTIELKPTPIVSGEVISTARGRQPPRFNRGVDEVPGSVEIVTDTDIHPPV